MEAPSGSKYSQYYINAGDIKNEGIEMVLGGTPVMTNDFRWKTSVNFSLNRNKVLELAEGLGYFNICGEPSAGAYAMRLEEGGSFGDIYGYKFVRDEQGQIALDDVTGLPKKDDTDLQKLGNLTPDFNLGWANTFTYKGWDLSMQFTSQLGFKILNEPRAFYENNSIAYNRLKSVEVAPYGGQYTLSSSQAQTFVSYYLEDGDFLKLTNLTIGYTFPIKPTNKWIKGARAYLSGDNLFCITGYSGLDPELSNPYPTYAGIDARDKYPSIRSFTFGVNLTF